jgi:hypothetical protein
MAVEAVTDLWWTVRDKRGFTNETVNSAILAIEPPGEETHEARWLALGYEVHWDDDDRCYHIVHGPVVVMAPTVQAVDAWIAAQKKEKNR